MTGWQLASFAVLAAVLLGGFAWYERSRPPSQVVALVAALAALAVAGRVALAAIPNVVATTDIVIFSGYALGAAPGFAVGALAGLVSNFWLGQGPWTPWQMVAWGLCGILGAALARSTRRRAGRLELTAACGLAGIAFGALLNFSLIVSYGGDLTLRHWLVLEARAVPFDLAHALGNVTLALVAGPAMVRMLVRFRERFEFRWRNEARTRRRPGLAGASATWMVLILVAAAPALAGGRGSATSWLEGARNSDGGFPVTPGGESSPQMTGWSMLGLEAAGVNPGASRSGGGTPVAYLRRHLSELRAATDLSLTILALRGAGIDVHRFAGRDLTAALLARRRRDGSYEGWPNPTAFAVMALRAAGSGTSAGPSLGWLRRAQNADGGWGSVAGAPSDSDSTGAVLEALAGSRGSRRGVRFLRRSQHTNGGWGLASSGPVNSQSTAWAVQGLLAAGLNPASVRRGGHSGLQYLASRRARDGHYRYSASSDQTPVWVTAQALAAVNREPFPLAPVPGARKASLRSAKGASSGAGITQRSSGGQGGGGGASNAVAPRHDGLGRDRRPTAARRVRGAPGAAHIAPKSEGVGARTSDSRARGGVGRYAGAGGDSSGGSSPLVPIGIGLGLAALVVLAARFAAASGRLNT